MSLKAFVDLFIASSKFPKAVPMSSMPSQARPALPTKLANASEYVSVVLIPNCVIIAANDIPSVYMPISLAI